ncbi:hypothetical protein CEJ87_15845, partial [Caldifermentibacillus hisashii]
MNVNQVESISKNFFQILFFHLKKTWRLPSLLAMAKPQEHLYFILKISNYVEFASLLEIYTFLTYKK